MHSIQQILDEKGHDVFALPSSATVFQAVELMSSKGVGALFVIDDEKLVGVISERDYARKIILKGRASRETAISEIMTAEVLTVDPHRTVDECLALMTRSRIRHLPVVENDRVVGVLSIGDLVKVKIDDQAQQIQSLESYIAGN